MRRAQKAFRLRQKTAQLAQAQRLELLETTVQQMSSHFRELSGVLMQMQKVREDPYICQAFLRATDHFDRLRRDAFSEDGLA